MRVNNYLCGVDKQNKFSDKIFMENKALLYYLNFI